MLHILRQPFSARSGCDILDDKTEAELRRAGVACRISDIWPDRPTRLLYLTNVIPGTGRLFKYGVAAPSCFLHLRRIWAGDVVWVHNLSLPFDEACCFEKAIKRRRAHYVYNIQDDWFSSPTYGRWASARVPLADLVVVPTAALRERVLELFPGAAVEVLEEPVDIERLRPSVAHRAAAEPLVVWCGNPYNFREIGMVAPALEAVCRKIPFRFRIVGGDRRPDITLRVPWEWFAYDFGAEGSLLDGAVAGLAPLEDSLFARCKGAYKVKTYLAAGIPPIVSPVGYQRDLVECSRAGFLARTDTEWISALSALVGDAAAATENASRARRFAETHLAHSVVIPAWRDVLSAHFPGLLAGASQKGMDTGRQVS
ncbi:MAG: hypothetical protein JXB04_06225 [Kiritimatiellae bacterium]|nr:hypothetical protein [Kiritimatiellia bacterium]